MPNKKVVKKLDKNTLAIILYLVEKLDGVLGKTHLQKMLFLTDLISVKKFKHPLTVLKYKKYTYGPFSDELDTYTQTLADKKCIEIREFPLYISRQKH